VFLKARGQREKHQKSGDNQPVIPDKVKILDRRNCSNIYDVTVLQIAVRTG
jgi:hypothetical protein